MPVCTGRYCCQLLHSDLADLCHVVSICSYRFFHPNQSPESKIGYQKQSIGTISGSSALKLSWDDLFGSEFYEVCFLGFTNKNTSLKKFVFFAI